ncbi:hypothetical protein KKG08_02650 [Patescibacteria group bacterium]|nr:hypothetical protein [Patescibacteria group bacterium]
MTNKVLLKILIGLCAIIIFLFVFIKDVSAETYTKTFTFATTAESFTGTSGGKSVLTYVSGVGNPAGSLQTNSIGRNNSDTSYWLWTGTWLSLGVSSGASVITNLRLQSASTITTVYNVVDAVTIGPYKLRDSLGVDQATLWTGRSPTGVEGSWVTTSSQANQAVPSGIQSPSSTIQLYLGRSIDLGNNAAAQVNLHDDQISFVVTYTIPTVSISMTTDGSAPFGNMGVSATRDTTSGDLNDVQTISVDVGPADLDIKSANFTGAGTLTLSSAPGPNIVLFEYSANGSDWNTFVTNDTYYVLATSVSQGGTQDTYLRLTTPTTLSTYGDYGTTITILATVP